MFDIRHITMEQTAQTMTYGGGGTAVAAGITASELGIIVGVVVGITGLFFQVWLGLRRDARERLEHEHRMSEATNGN